MFSSSSSSSSFSNQRRPKHGQQRNVKGMQRSGSIFSAITKIVSAPLSWFASNENLEDLGKRQRVEPQERDDDEQVGSVRKRMRVESPPAGQDDQCYAGGYLDPPEASVRRSQSNVLPRPSYRSRMEASNKRASIVRAPSLNVARTMSMDPPALHYATYNRESAAIPLQIESSMGVARNSASVGPRDVSMRAPTSPFRIRSSLTPQPSPSKPAHRENSAPPPISFLTSRPVFVKPPVGEDSNGRELRAQKTMSLGSIAEYSHSRASRSPARELNLSDLTSLQSAPAKLSSSNSSALNVPSKTLRALEMFKTPIIPSRYKDSRVIPEFLRQKKVHVPIPMSKKGRKVKPSLGMASKIEHEQQSSNRAENKPYAGKGSLSKMLAKRRAEEELEKCNELSDEDEGFLSPRRKDVGVTARIVSASEDENQFGRGLRSIAEEDPFMKPAASYDRNQPHGRVGSVRTPRNTAHSRAAQLGQRKTGTKFSAAFDEDDSVDEMSMEDQVTENTRRNPVFEAPAGFSFASNVEINHNAEMAKEPPISSLPYSFGKPEIIAVSSEATKTFRAQDRNEAKMSDSSSKFVIPAAPIKQVPKVAVVPPTPEQVLGTPNFFASSLPPSRKSGAGASPSPAPSSIPNFFANSAFLQGAKSGASELGGSTETSSRTTFLPTLPTKDAGNPLLDDDTCKTPSTSYAPASEKPVALNTAKPLPFGSFNKPSSLKEIKQSTSTTLNFFASSSCTPSQSKDLSAPSDGQRPASAPSFGTPNIVPSMFTPSASPPPLFGSSPGISSTPSAGFAPVFEQKSMGFVAPSMANTSTTQEPARPFSAPIVSSGSPLVDASQPAPLSSFTFGAPAISSGPSTNETPKSPFGALNTNSSGFSFSHVSPPPADASKAPFSFGAPPSSQHTTNESKSSFAGFGGNAGPGFGFGTPNKTADSTSVTETVPFAFGSSPSRQLTPPKKNDDGDMAMEESPTRMDTNSKIEGNGEKPALSLSFGTSQPSIFGQNSASSTNSLGFSFGSSSAASNPFGATLSETDRKTSFSFGSTPSAPQITSSFSFGGQKSEISATPSSFGAGTGGHSFSQTSTPTSGTTPFSFGATSSSTNLFSTPPPIQQTPSFTFGSSSIAPSNPFNFGASQPSSPAGSVSGLPQSPATANSPFTFGQSSGIQAGTTASASPFGSPASSGANLFNIGAPPPQTGPRPVKKLPRRGASVKR